MIRDTRSVVEAYFDASTQKTTDAAHALLAPGLKYVGPTASYESAEAFNPALIGFAAMARSARLTDLVVEGNRRRCRTTACSRRR